MRALFIKHVDEVGVLHCEASTQSWCFVFFTYLLFWKFYLPFWPHYSCNIGPTASGTCQTCFTKHHGWADAPKCKRLGKCYATWQGPDRVSKRPPDSHWTFAGSEINWPCTTHFGMLHLNQVWLQSFPSHRSWDFVMFCFGSSPALLWQ